MKLAEQLAAHSRFKRPIPGGQIREQGIMWVPSDSDDWIAGGAGHPVPDLSDDATGGCLLLMLSRSTSKLVSAIETADGWTVDVHNRVEEHGDTLGEASAHALLALWGQE